jgi:hypothetical protein
VIRWNLRPYNWLGADGGVVSAYIIVVGGWVELDTGERACSIFKVSSGCSFEWDFDQVEIFQILENDFGGEQMDLFFVKLDLK